MGEEFTEFSEDFAKSQKFFSKMLNEYKKVMKEATDGSERSAEKVKQTYKEIKEEMIKGNKDNVESAKISKNINDRMLAADKKNKQYKERILLDHLKKTERLFARTAARGEGNVMGFMRLLGQQSTKMGGAFQLSELEQKMKSGSQLGEEEKRKYNELSEQGAGDSPLMPLFRKFDKIFGTGSKWDKVFQGHGKMAAGLIGGGAAAMGVKMVMKGVQLAIEASPMLQQMLKLWKFGIMMILRPIGDFFGFIMRPIMILMLRKFIIPFYQKYMPIMIRLGNDIGILIAGILDWMTKDPLQDISDVTHTVSETGKIVPYVPPNDPNAESTDWFKGFWGGFIIDFWAAADTGLEKIPVTWEESGGLKVDGDTERTTKEILDEDYGGIAKGDHKADAMALDRAKKEAEIKARLDKEYASVQVAHNEALAAQAAALASQKKMDELLESFKETGGIIEEAIVPVAEYFKNERFIGTAMEGKLSKIVNAGISEGAYEAANAPKGHVTSANYSQATKDLLAKMAAFNNNVIGAAGGFDGIVTKPTMFMTGESGAEHVTVTPSGSQSGTNITVNIQNMSASQQDLNILKQTILSVVQEANTRRGRI